MQPMYRITFLVLLYATISCSIKTEKENSNQNLKQEESIFPCANCWQKFSNVIGIKANTSEEIALDCKLKNGIDCKKCLSNKSKSFNKNQDTLISPFERIVITDQKSDYKKEILREILEIDSYHQVMEIKATYSGLDFLNENLIGRLSTSEKKYRLEKKSELYKNLDL